MFLTCTDIFRNPNWIKQGIKILKKDKKLKVVSLTLMLQQKIIGLEINWLEEGSKKYEKLFK